jgi:hypothetical protein
MKIKLAILSIVVLVAAVLALVAWPGPAARASEKADPQVFASPVNGGCYITAPNQCRLHIEPYTINVGSGQRLEAVKLQANGVTIYDFRTDVSNPPPSSGSTYTLSNVALDFAATCGTTYVLNVLGKNLADPNFLNMGQTASFTCPSSVP